MKVFLSYARTDAGFAMRIAEDLRAAGVDLWVDRFDIPSGAIWDREIEQALRASSHLLVILSPASVESHSVMDEVSFALEEGKTVVPVLYLACDRPFRLRRFQYVDFTDDYARGLLALVDGLPKAKPGPGHNAQDPTPAGEPADPGPSRPSSPAPRQASSAVAAITPVEAKLGEEVVLKDSKRILCLAFSPRGDLLATGGGDRGIFFSTDFAVRVWRLPERALVAELTRHTDEVTSLAFSPDGKILASSSLDGVRLWQLPQGKLLRTLEHEDVRSGMQRQGYDPLRFSPDGRVLAAGIYAWRLPDASLLPPLHGLGWQPDRLEVESKSSWEAYQFDRHNFTGLVLSSNWASLAIAQGNRIEIHSSDDGRRITRLETKDAGNLWDFAFSDDGRRLCSSCHQEGANRIVIWSLPGGERLVELEDAFGGARVTFSRDGQLLASGHTTEGVRLWRVADARRLDRIDFPSPGLSTNGAMAVAFSPDDQWLAAGCRDKCVRLWPVVRH